MAKPNYAFEKRQRDLAKQRKKQEKRLKKAGSKEAKAPDDSGGEAQPAEPGEAGADAGAGSGSGGGDGGD